MKKRVVIFDFDGTIADTFPAILKIVNLHAKDFGFSPINPREFEKLRNKSLQELIKKFKISFFKLPFILIEGRRELNREMDNVRLFPGIKETLLALKEKGLRLSILTSNSEGNVKKLLERYNLDGIFDFIHAEFDLFGKAKNLKNLMQKNKLLATDVIYVGDEIRDIEACKANNVQIISVTWGFNKKEILQKYKPDYIVDKPEEIIKIFANTD